MVCCSLLFVGLVAVAAVEGINSQFDNIFNSEPCVCPQRVTEICGTDGLTYRNLCYLDCAAKLNPDLKILHAGACKSDYEECHCPLIWRPVCGSDGLVYGNMCEFLCTALSMPYDLQVIDIENCPPTEIQVNPEVGVDVQTEAPPEPVFQTEIEPEPETEEPDIEKSEEDMLCERYPKCDRKKCKLERVNRLCGSNRHTYRNPCQFCCARERLPGLTIASIGKCPKKKPRRRPKKERKNFDPEEDQFCS